MLFTHFGTPALPGRSALCRDSEAELNVRPAVWKSEVRATLPLVTAPIGRLTAAVAVMCPPTSSASLKAMGYNTTVAALPHMFSVTDQRRGISTASDAKHAQSHFICVCQACVCQGAHPINDYICGARPIHDRLFSTAQGLGGSRLCSTVCVAWFLAAHFYLLARGLEP